MSAEQQPLPSVTTATDLSGEALVAVAFHAARPDEDGTILFTSVVRELAPEDSAAAAGEPAAGGCRVELEQELQRARAARDKADTTLRLYSDSLAAVAHDLKSPLATIKGLAQLLVRS